MKSYCTQNNGDCSTCSLVNYNRDCQNNPIHGGKRPGAGNKPIANPLPVHSIRCTPEEYQQLKEHLKQIRKLTKPSK